MSKHYSDYGPPVEMLQTMEWLPIADAARLKNCSGNTILRMARAGEIPVELRPRPDWRNDGPPMVKHVHIPSFPDRRFARWNRETRRYDHKVQPRTKLGAFLRSKRRSMGWTQGDVAKAIRSTHNTISGWELGLHPPSIDKAWLLCELYNLTQAERVSVFEALAWAQSPEDDNDTR